MFSVRYRMLVTRAFAPAVLHCHYSHLWPKNPQTCATERAHVRGGSLGAVP